MIVSEFSMNLAPDADAGDTKVFVRPKFPPPAPVPGALWVHGASGTSLFAIDPLGRQSHLTNTLVTGTGCTGLSSDLGGPSTWGNELAMTRMTQAYNRLQLQPGVKPGPVWLVSSSMGAHTSLNWAAQNKAKVKGIISIIPVINPTDIVTNNRMGYAASVNAAYVGGWSESTYGAVYNPQTLASAGKLSGIPMLMWYGTLDDLCRPAEALAFAAKPGMDVTLIPIDDGHVMTAYDKPDHATALAFMRAHP